MRIISGLLKSHRFSPPKGFTSRPTTDFAKEGLFNILENEFSLHQLNILDLFSGTGNIAFEFASREAGEIIAVDKNYKCIRFLNTFAQKHNLSPAFVGIKKDVFQYLKQCNRSFDIIFADPPFGSDLYPDLVLEIMTKDILREDGLFILEHDKHTDFTEHPDFYKTKKYGKVIFSFFKHNA